MYMIDAYAVSVIRNIFHLFQYVMVDTFLLHLIKLCVTVYIKKRRIFAYYRGAGIIET